MKTKQIFSNSYQIQKLIFYIKDSYGIKTRFYNGVLIAQKGSYSQKAKKELQEYIDKIWQERYNEKIHNILYDYESNNREQYDVKYETLLKEFKENFKYKYFTEKEIKHINKQLEDGWEVFLDTHLLSFEVVRSAEEYIEILYHDRAGCFCCSGIIIVILSFIGYILIKSFTR